ncbi:hypothetical protein [Maritalea porphyrae]|uniref:hypothetical protein n=1 Tax=Maritalea porphyrae TaxID=880732 RepID=UPI0022AEA27F|nr:hypothetical protein [Maritalea porphyrae]MCZ4272165.1 hypothetical protein [Maritalea porphyrae]
MPRPPSSSLIVQSDRSHKAELATRSISLLLVLISLIAFIFNKDGLAQALQIEKTTLELGVIMISLLGALFIDQITTSFFHKSSQDRVIESHDQIMAAIQSSSTLQCFTSDNAFYNHIEQRVKHATEVRNTFVGYKTASGNPNALDEASLDSYISFLTSDEKSSKAKVWTDIVAYNEFFGKRYENIKILLNGKETSARHFARVIRHNIPVLNFTIFDFDSYGNDREVVFGWLHSDNFRNRRLFRSNDPNIIELFESYFSLLSLYRLQEDVELNYKDGSLRAGSEISDRQGWWFCEGTNQAGDVVSESVFHVSFREHGVELDGIVNWNCSYGRQLESSTETISHKSDKVSYTEQKMFLEYRDHASDRRGICVYNFSTTPEGAVVNGYLHDAGSVERIQLQGYKLDSSKEEYAAATDNARRLSIARAEWNRKKMIEETTSAS